MHVAEDSDAALVPFVKLRQVRSEGIGVQQADHYRELAFRSDAADIGGTVSELSQLRTLLRHGLDQRELLVRVFASLFISLRRARALRDEDCQRRSFQLAAGNFGQVELRLAVIGCAAVVEGKIQVAIEGDDSLVNRLGFLK